MKFKALRPYLVPIGVIVFFVALLGVSIKYLLYQSRVITDRAIVDDVARLAQIFKRIDERCKIMGFDRQKNPIDFLTVEKFVGSEIGSMNLMRPQDWEGPYAADNPAVQGRVYDVVRTGKGYFIVPGDGVRLNNGKIVGKDLILDEQADVEQLATDPQALQFEGRPMAAKIMTSGVSRGQVLEALVPAAE